ncbi:unnamed protein product [Fusarium graminearum]|nr:unnamed protein product [Fusarium graminearum]
MRLQQISWVCWALCSYAGLALAVGCNQLSNPYSVPGYDSQFELVCNSYSTGGDQIGSSFEVIDLETCISLCADTRGCKIALFDKSQYLCYLLDATDGPAPNNLYDMAALLTIPTTTAMPSTTSVATTTSLATTTQSAGPAQTPCSQLENPTYIDGVKFSILCGSQSTGGNQIDFSNRLRSLPECMAFCAENLACRAVTFDNTWQECALYDGFNGFINDVDRDMAVVASRPVMTTTEDLASLSTTTSSDASISTSEFTTSTLYTAASASTSDSPETTSLFPSSGFTSETTLPTFTTTSDVTDTTVQSTTESTSLSTESTTTSLAAISLSTALSQSESSETVSESTPDIISSSTSAGESSSVESSTIATTESFLHTEISTTETLTTGTPTTETLTTGTPSTEMSAIEESTTTTSATTMGTTQVTGSQIYESTSELSSLLHYSQTALPYSLSSFTTINLGSKTLSASDSTVIKTASEHYLPTSILTPTAIHTTYPIVTAGHAYTKTMFAETVTTVTYTTIDPSNTTALITTCAPITLLYSPCGCKHQVYPSVDMTTVACTHGGDIITLTVPKAAYETGNGGNTHPIVQYPPGWTGGYQTDAAGDGYPVVQPTAGSQVVSKPGLKNDQSKSLTRPTGSQEDSHPSYKVYQPAIPTSTGGSNGDTSPGQGNTQPSAPAQGSPKSNSNTPTKPSKPSSPESLTTETSTIRPPQLETSAVPSQPSPSDHSQVPSEPKVAPYATPVAVSGAHSHELSLWITMGAMLGAALLL